jgi:hypothetical protein
MKRIERLFLLSPPLFVVHAVEEYLTKSYEIDPSFGMVGQFIGLSSLTVFLVEQVLLFIFLFIVAAMVYRGAVPKVMAIILGLIFLVELSHPLLSIYKGNYSPGLVSGMLLLVLAFFYWQQLYIQFKGNPHT